MKKSLQYSIFMLLASSFCAANPSSETSQAPTESSNTKEMPVVSNVTETSIFSIGNSETMQIALRVFSGVMVIATLGLEYLIYKSFEGTKYFIIAIGTFLCLATMAVASLAVSLYDPQISCTPEGIILPAKCDIENFSFFEVLLFNMRYLPVIGYDKIESIEQKMVKFDENDEERSMVVLKTTSGELYYINPTDITVEKLNELYAILKKRNPNIKLNISEEK
ncbi:MAG: hypothetical protein AAF335_02290 [Bacteroidota bacterium]